MALFSFARRITRNAAIDRRFQIHLPEASLSSHVTGPSDWRHFRGPTHTLYCLHSRYFRLHFGAGERPDVDIKSNGYARDYVSRGLGGVVASSTWHLLLRIAVCARKWRICHLFAPLVVRQVDIVCPGCRIILSHPHIFHSRLYNYMF